MIRPAPLPHPLSQRLHLQVRGMVQGVGFRPFVYTLATELGLGGWVRNNDSGVDIEVEGRLDELTKFVERLERDRPAHSVLFQLETDWLAPCGYDRFEIQASDSDSPAKSAWILPDLAPCPACLSEIFDPHNRRYQYPFTNCTHCGPRYSILNALPYDRPHTTLQSFRMCPDCQKEYDNPRDRRFHAQPNACPVCGPQLELWNSRGQVLASGASTISFIAQAADYLREGQVLALKGLGGFHLMVDARNEAAVQRLRDRKHRPTKPLAVMYPTLDAIRQDCCISPAEANCLTATAAPIVLLQRRSESTLAPSIAPHQSTVGAMLPSTPLHHLLLTELGFPIVTTSGNRSHEPICFDEGEAIEELGAIADMLLVHNRPIARPLDDSVVRVVGDRTMVLRRSRGYALAPIAGLHPPGNLFPGSQRKSSQDDSRSSLVHFNGLELLARKFISERCPSEAISLLAVGGHLKNTVALSVQGQILLSQHLGDLDDAQTTDRFHATIAHLLDLYAAKPVAIAHDAHPDYASTQYAQALSQQLNIPTIPIQHHYAHVLSGLVDNGLEPPVLGVTWDGTGYGADGTLWGGEWLAVPNTDGFQRVAHLRPFPLLGGNRAAREPRRAALGLLYEAFGEGAFGLDSPTLQAFQPQELKVLQIMLQNRVNTPRTSSVGRLFDAIASLIGLCQCATFEGEAAMQLESVRDETCTTVYPYTLTQDAAGTWILDWQPMLSDLLADCSAAVGAIAAKFHNTLVEMVVDIAHRVELAQIILTGGCFQNRYLLERAIRQLRAEGFLPHWHHQLPPNDGGLAVGQMLGASWFLQQTTSGGATCA
jgi:hydrogenase maturation protein HypF